MNSETHRSMEEKSSATPHVLVLPLPIVGHVKPFLNLSKLLSHFGLHVTFVNSHRSHARLHHLTHLPSLHSQFPRCHFASITDGLPSDHQTRMPHLDLDAFRLLISPTSRSMVAKEFRELLAGISPPPTCIVADGLMSTIAMDAAEDFGVPVIAFRTNSATCIWVTIHLTNLVEEGAIPLQDKDLDKMVTGIPSLENFLRGRDLPAICRLNPEDPIVNLYIKETSAMSKASSLILNTFLNLESPIISELSTIFPKVYTIGPLHSLFKTHIPSDNSLSSDSGSLGEESSTAIGWLNSQKPNTVLYVGFGTVVRLSRGQILEIWHGLVNSGKPFLWAISENSIAAADGGSVFRDGVPEELDVGTKERGLLVDWVPQEEVLAHPAVGGFLGHCGWNSTLESICEGVPMICWPLIADQTVNSRCVCEMWRVGVDMNGMCDRVMVEKMVGDVMESKREEIVRSTVEIARIVGESVEKGGSSYSNLVELIEDIRSLNLKK